MRRRSTSGRPASPGASETASLGAGPGRDHEANAGHVGGTMGAAETSPGASPMGAPLLGAEVDPSMISTPRPASDAQAMSPSTSSAYSAPSTRSADALGATHADREATNVAVWTELPRPAAAVGAPAAGRAARAPARMGLEAVPMTAPGDPARAARPSIAETSDADAPLTVRAPGGADVVQQSKAGAAQREDQPTPLAPQPRRDAGKAERPQTWVAATAPAPARVPAAAPRFAPMLFELRDGPAALQVFEDLKKRHGEVLADKQGELRTYVGSDGNTWYRVVALPAGTEAEAIKICRSLGSEGHALGCTVARQ